MEFIGKRVGEGRYQPAISNSLKIEETMPNIGLVNNSVYYKYQSSNLIEEEE